MTTSHFETLPITDIAQILPFEDVKSLSLVSRVMRDAVRRPLFSGTLSITCPVSPDRDLDGHINKYGEFISRLHFNINLELNPYGTTRKEKVLSRASLIWGTSSGDTIKSIIRGEALSHIDTLSVKFNVNQFVDDNDGWGHRAGSIHVFEYSEHPQEVYKEEQKLIWRAQYTEVWNQIAANPNIKKMKISNLLPKLSSAWYTDEWETFLGRLEDLDISIFGGDNGAGWEAQRMEGFAGFSEDLSTFMMQHAINVTRLRVEAHEHDLLGRCYLNDVPLPFENAQLPALCRLELERIMVSGGLLDFLEGRADILQEIKLHDCMCCCESGNPSWADLWKLIREVNTNVNNISHSQSETPPLADPVPFVYTGETLPDSEEAAEIRELLKQDKGLVLWRYVEIDDKYGFIIERSDENVERSVEGRDQLEYTMLLEELEKRRKKGL
ncbi:hypothetical protein F53441_10230 [Fusarium austroafricanum]|uniref:F-box domain-containing protein n=1 Tax=Fusarium austroafricanum TaxID=2364996 RepID=A0A8H4K972_9HYPO|nr:hypothetical protein F53441_10230 [Fusarium austroafricanum]